MGDSMTNLSKFLGPTAPYILINQGGLEQLPTLIDKIEQIIDV